MAYELVTTLAASKEYLKPLLEGETKVVAFDFETSPIDEWRGDKDAALDPHKADITGVSLSIAPGTGIYVPIKHQTGKNAEDIGGIMLFLSKEIFQNKHIIKVAHNLSFEAMFLYKYGVVVLPPVYDTIAAAQLTLKEEMGFRELKDCGLKTLVPALFNVELPTYSEVTEGKHFDELDPEDNETVRYACADSDFALRLYYRFNEWFDRFLPKHRFVCEEIESPTAVYTGIMKYNGIAVDRELMEQKKQEAEQKLAELKRQICEAAGRELDIGANAATDEFKWFLYEELKLPVVKTTAKFAEAADDETMVLLKEWCTVHNPVLVRFFELIQEYRKWGKIKSTYIDGYLQHINEATGRIHPDLFPLA
ncbi:MAG: DNA polymerase [Peptococcaceae bacterium]|jgi:DNA polymerase-1|nr:DNA polymerase [Eubacteriales bacterium]MDH7526489.1 DNA polymerase [Peptococcaceae bacterium]